jgi:poly-gamma-glutamate synthesis protein (capsule biosynthesis protein)
MLSLGALVLALAGTAAAQGQPAPQPAREASAQEKPARPASAPIHIAWVGDIVLEVPWRPSAVSPRALFDGVRERLLSSDLVIGNLESPLTDWTEQTPYKNKADVEAGRDVIFRVASPEAARALFDGGIRVVSLANNHTADYAEPGLLDTIQRLRNAGVLYAGAGENLAAAEAPRVAEIRGWRIGIICFSDVVPKYSWAEMNRPGIATAKESERLVQAVARARPTVDLLIVVLHWGVQFDRTPSPRQQFLAQGAQRAGADLVLGAHPHVLQGVGCLGRVPIVYSAGNFVFPTMSLPTRRTAIFEFEFSGKGKLAVRVVPVIIDDRGAPQLADDEPRNEILTEMGQLSLLLGLRFEGDSGSCGETLGSAPVSSGGNLELH